VKLKERIALWFAWRAALKQVRPWLEQAIGRPLTWKERQMKNWKTTLLGMLGGLTGAEMAGWTKPDGHINWLAVAFALLMTAKGYFTKDKDVTGGSISQPTVANAPTLIEQR